jgi:hypothetical protein
MEQCSKCGGPRNRPGQRYCLRCHAAYMRANRPRHSEMAPAARAKANVRRHTNSLIDRGHIVRDPCESCGAEPAEAHHLDYRNPWDIRFLCRSCHLAVHARAG